MANMVENPVAQAMIRPATMAAPQPIQRQMPQFGPGQTQMAGGGAYRPAMGSAQPMANMQPAPQQFNPASVDATQAAQNAWYASMNNMPKYGPGQMMSAPVQQQAQMYQPGAAPVAPTGSFQQGMRPLNGPQTMQSPMSGPPNPLARSPYVGPTNSSLVAPGNPVAHAMGPAPNPNLAMSDETQKVVDQRSVADDFLDHMKPYTYKYKDPSLEPRIQPTGGTYMGVMAQDLERVPGIGHQLVIDTPHGKMVDQKTALSATMAGLARLNERMRAVEQDSLGKGGNRGPY